MKDLNVKDYNNQIIFASNNKNKLNEIRNILNDFNILSLNDINCNIDIEEDKNSFYENALEKAKIIYNLKKKPVIADDSGLCIEELNNWPGVMTKRFIDARDEERNLEIVRKVEKYNNKRAKVICSLVYYDDKNIIEGLGEITGNIVPPRGDNGFGFDPIFEVENGKTLAELSPKDKNNCSARYLACIDLKNKLKNISSK